MKQISSITKKDLIKVANLQGFENKRNNMIHLYLDREGKVLIENHISGVSPLLAKTLMFLKTKYIIN
ncbi:hypothetical protein LY11_03172 [Pedobacter cryoconitis]|uniref:Uncharacterized protein n=1 Tax=Pedobacter cryoconitis TaxID=188932 RepID=A0A327SJJ5_9SPHI|nr:hypothetical protein LY11_03172 [Pedobacter cryoconitis]